MAVIGENTSVQNIGPVISFEDALEKEIKYREWIKSSSHFPESRSSYLLFATSRELPPNHNVDERKTEKVLPLQSHSQSLSTQIPGLAQEFDYSQMPTTSIERQPYWCSLCQVSCMSKFNYKSHCRGTSHKSKQVQIRATSSSHFLISRLWCNVCALQCSSQIDYEQHCQGKSHMYLQGQASSSGPQTSQFWCSLCQVQCACQLNYEQHFRGKKHIERQVELGLSAVGPPN